MKKLIVLGSLVVFSLGLLAGCTETTQPQDNQQKQNQNEQNNSQQSQTGTLTPSQSETPSQTAKDNSHVYKNQTYGFTFSYPDSYAFVTPAFANLEDKIVQVQTARDVYPKTNFGEAAFAVSASYAKSLQACLALNEPENGDGFKTKTTINGVDFYMTKGTGVGAGNIYDSRIYRAFVGNQTCVELDETIHTSNIGNYEPGTVTEVDKAPIWKELDAMRDSFKFEIAPVTRISG